MGERVVRRRSQRFEGSFLSPRGTASAGANVDHDQQVFCNAGSRSCAARVPATSIPAYQFLDPSGNEMKTSDQNIGAMDIGATPLRPYAQPTGTKYFVRNSGALNTSHQSGNEPSLSVQDRTPVAA